MNSPIGSLHRAIPTFTDHRPPPIQAGTKANDHATDGLGSDQLKAVVRGSGRALKVVGETLFPGSLGPSVLVSGAITVGLGALVKIPMRQSLISAGGYGASMVAGNLAYRAVHALHGSDFAGKMAASAAGTAIGLGEAALLKRPASFITLLANSIGAGFGASQAAKAIEKHE